MKIRLFAALAAAALLVSACGPKDPADMKAEDWQKELAKHGKHFTPDGFVNSAAANDTALIGMYLRGTMSVDAPGNSGNTALAMAAFKGNVEAVKMLLAAGANMDVQNSTGATLLLDISTRSTANHIEVLKIFLDHKLQQTGATELGNTVASAFIKAAEYGNINAMQEYINRGVDVNGKGADGLNALITATNNGKVKAVELLIANKCELNDTDKDFNTALAYAEENGWPEIAKILRKAGAKRFKNKER